MSSYGRKDSVGLRIRGCLGSIPTGGDILPLDFFHVVKPLMSILSLLPILSICKKLDLRFECPHPPPVSNSVLTIKLHLQTDKTSFRGPYHLPKILGKKGKSNLGNSVRATNNIANTWPAKNALISVK